MMTVVRTAGKTTTKNSKTGMPRTTGNANSTEQPTATHNVTISMARMPN